MKRVKTIWTYQDHTSDTQSWPPRTHRCDDLTNKCHTVSTRCVSKTDLVGKKSTLLNPPKRMFLENIRYISCCLSRTRCRFPWDTCHIQIFHRTKCIHRQYIHDMWKNHLWRCTLQHCSSNTFLPIHRQTQHCMYLCSSAKRESVLPEHSSGIIAREGYERVTRMRVV